MLNRYKVRFQQLAAENRKAFIPYAMLGWPNPEQSLTMIEHMIKSRVSALELGIAFSDPVADGPIIQNASCQTIASGFSVEDAFTLLARVRKIDPEIPIGILVYFNTVLSKGIDRFFDMAKSSGVDGVLIADLPPENIMEVKPAAQEAGIDLIFLISPVTPVSRLETILLHASGFLYLVSRLGVTGVSERVNSKDEQLAGLITEVKKRTNLPICAGFGISNSSDAAGMFEVGVDGVITASRLIEIVNNEKEANGFLLLSKLYEEMLAACDKSHNKLLSRKAIQNA